MWKGIDNDIAHTVHLHTHTHTHTHTHRGEAMKMIWHAHLCLPTHHETPIRVYTYTLAHVHSCWLKSLAYSNPAGGTHTFVLGWCRFRGSNQGMLSFGTAMPFTRWILITLVQGIQPYCTCLQVPLVRRMIGTSTSFLPAACSGNSKKLNELVLGCTPPFDSIKRTLCTICCGYLL